MEESLDLWSAVLAQTPAPASPQILSLFPSIFSVFELGTDNVRQALEVTESYIMLAPREFLDGHVRFRLLTVLESLLGTGVRLRIGLVPYLASALIRVGETSPNENEQTYASIAESFISSSFLRTLLSGLHEAHEASFSTGPNKKYTPIDGVAETDRFSVLARLALASPNIFISAIRAATQSPEEQTLNWLLKEWFFHFDSIGDITTKKLHTLALTHLLTLNGPSSPPPAYLLNNLQSYLSIWTDVITELADGTEDAEDGRRGDYLVNVNNGAVYSPEGKYHDNEPPETTRRRAWTLADPLHRINIREYVTDHLRTLVGACGGLDQFRAEWLVNVDQDVVNEFVKLGVF